MRFTGGPFAEKMSGLTPAVSGRTRREDVGRRWQAVREQARGRETLERASRLRAWSGAIRSGILKLRTHREGIAEDG